MYDRNNTPDDHDDNQDAVVIPLPRKAPDDDIGNLHQTGLSQPVWWYDQTRKRGGDRHFSGLVNHVHGAEAERLRGELAEVVRELLAWAAEQQSGDHSTEDGESA